MPIYEYQCISCGKFEKIQKITEPPLEFCPVCQGKARRIISKNVGIQFKGSGFYKTDIALAKEKARSLNKERQKDNESILDGDIGGYVAQAEATDKKVMES